MTAVRIDRFDVPSGTHDERVLAWTHALAVDTLSGRVVWCAGALPPGRAAAGRLRALLREQIVDPCTDGGRRVRRHVDAQHSALAWSSVLGDVVEADRDDRVGGTLHVRPAVAPR
ncbi:MAG TPA: hypothetical protein VFU94_08815 [Conexibacter sp.]|nr:hypothetical protein [Conexibacter sp.]